MRDTNGFENKIINEVPQEQEHEETPKGKEESHISMSVSNQAAEEYYQHQIQMMDGGLD